ncbi:MAG: 3-deoxy-8-phosphooctulonate synthase [Candidatus Marinimicrobia bacterium]|nr:3-deoxy-8-phosphooctulonate synthase [Candidatus Neomarinimicrobiota bacterium]
MAEVAIKNIWVGKQQPLLFILGPCVIESRDHTLFMAEQLQRIMTKLRQIFVFKASYDKANRTSVDSFRGPGLEEGLKILAEVRHKFNIPVLTDIHEVSHAIPAAEVVDVLQIPAFLCRQTDLLIAAGKSGKVVNVKKGQFLAPGDMKHIVRKIESTGNKNILLTDRGTSFGYGGLLSDVRAVPIMQQTGYPVIFDATHSVQIPGGQITGGNRQFIPGMARAMVAAGVDGIFMEVHDNVDQAKSDRATQYPLNELATLITELVRIKDTVKEFYDI